jgi:hypothetical protein
MTDTEIAAAVAADNREGLAPQQEVQYIEGGDEGLAQELGADEGIAISANDGSDDDDDGEGIAIDINQDFRRPLLKDGEYSGVITRCEYKKSENSGQPMLTGVVELETSGEESVSLPFYLSFSPKAQAGTMTTLQTVFAEHYKAAINNGKFLPKRIADEDMLVNQPVRVKVKTRTYEGAKVNNIQRFVKPKQGGQAYA